jgi:DNA-binding response OmpR family regulator
MRKIALIEDDADLYSLVKYNLEKEGFAFVGLQTGRSSLEFLRREKPDLAILDIMLPDVDGLEICKAIRSSPELSQVPVIFLTARASEADRIIGLELGANGQRLHRETVLRARAGGARENATPRPVHRPASDAFRPSGA